MCPCNAAENYASPADIWSSKEKTEISSTCSWDLIILHCRILRTLGLETLPTKVKEGGKVTITAAARTRYIPTMLLLDNISAELNESLTDFYIKVNQSRVDRVRKGGVSPTFSQLQFPSIWLVSHLSAEPSLVEADLPILHLWIPGWNLS